MLAWAASAAMAAGAGAAPGEVPARPAAASIHILGNFNGWDESLWTADPGMTHVSTFVWRDTVDIFPRFVREGYQEFKFVTDKAWDSPPDYVLCPDRLDEYARLSGPVCLLSGGLNLVLYADAVGRYEMTLDEETLRYSARLVEPFAARITGTLHFGGGGSRILPTAEVRVFKSGRSLNLARTTSDAASGAFAVDSLAGGAYDLAFTAPGYREARVYGAGVVAGGALDVGTVTLVSGCTSQYSTIQVVGAFNNWDANVPSMTQVAGCVWTDTLAIQEGCYLMKFRTGGTWDPDYGTCTFEDQSCQVPLAGNVCVVGGMGTALGQMRFPVTGNYEFRLDEGASSYEIKLLTTAVEPASWGFVKRRYR